MKIHYNTEIRLFENENGELKAFVDQRGHRWTADLSSATATRPPSGTDPETSAIRAGAAGPDGMDPGTFTIYLGVKGKPEGLIHHNYFLGSNFKEYADNIFRTAVAPEKPYYYVNVSSKSNPACAPEGCENIFVLCPVPDLRYKPDWSDSDKLCRHHTA